jgi:hypothetical protein
VRRLRSGLPEGIDLTGMIMELRGELELPPELDALQVAYGQAAAMAEAAPPGALLLPGAALRADAALLARVRGAARPAGLLPMTAPTLPWRWKSAATSIRIRRRRFLAGHRWAQLVVGDGLLLAAAPLAARRPPARPGRGPGQSAAMRRRIASADFYVIEPRAYHADHARLVAHYDGLRKDSGCAMNLDLQRIAVPPRASGYPGLRMGRRGGRPGEQARWLLQGRRPARIVVEDPADRELLRRVTGVPVLHLAELAAPNEECIMRECRCPHRRRQPGRRRRRQAHGRCRAGNRHPRTQGTAAPQDLLRHPLAARPPLPAGELRSAAARGAA